jgi:micrococcal nuclease
MDRTTSFFWALIISLLAATTFYGVGAYRLQSANQQREAKLETGDTVALARIIDGDTLVLAKEGQGNVTVRILGIKTLESKHGKDEMATYGRAAEEAIKRIVGDKPVRVLLNNPPRDRHGRTLATLYAAEQDVGLELVAQGHALVYSAFPFSSMPLYLQEQKQARAKHLGLWADPDVSAKAEAWFREWEKKGS